MVSSPALPYPYHQGELSSPALGSSPITSKKQGELALWVAPLHSCHQSQLHCVAQVCSDPALLSAAASHSTGRARPSALMTPGPGSFQTPAGGGWRRHTPPPFLCHLTADEWLAESTLMLTAHSRPCYQGQFHCAARVAARPGTSAHL